MARIPLFSERNPLSAAIYATQCSVYAAGASILGGFDTGSGRLGDGGEGGRRERGGAVAAAAVTHCNDGQRHHVCDALVRSGAWSRLDAMRRSEIGSLLLSLGEVWY
eukprot:3498058-Rhodomonas_salina.1